MFCIFIKLLKIISLVLLLWNHFLWTSFTRTPVFASFSLLLVLRLAQSCELCVADCSSYGRSCCHLWQIPSLNLQAHTGRTRTSHTGTQTDRHRIWVKQLELILLGLLLWFSVLVFKGSYPVFQKRSHVSPTNKVFNSSQNKYY